MNIHKNARLTPRGRERIVMQVLSGQTPQAAARAAGVCPRTVRKWVARFKAEDVAGLKDRSSRPRRLYRPTPADYRRAGGSLAAPALDRQADRGRSSASRRPPSAVSCGASASIGWLRWSRPNRFAVMSGSILANSSTSTSSSSAASSASAIASPAAIGKATSRGGGWEYRPYLPSTTPRASPSRKSCLIRRRRARSPSSGLLSPTTRASASPSRAS